jgi:acetoin utilization protein AcuB
MTDLIPVSRYMTPTPVTIDEDRSLFEAKELMHLHKVRHLPVLHEGKLGGLLTHRDVAVAESLEGLAPTEIPVRRVMTSVLFTCGPNAHVEAVAREMAEHHYGSALVVDPDHPTRIIGVFTTTDALRALAEMVEERVA